MLPGELGYEAGRRAAQAAVRAAQQLVPSHKWSRVRIYGDLERWFARSDWIVGWWEGMRLSPFVGLGGLYGYIVPPLGAHPSGQPPGAVQGGVYQEGGRVIWRGLIRSSLAKHFPASVSAPAAGPGRTECESRSVAGRRPSGGRSPRARTRRRSS